MAMISKLLPFIIILICICTIYACEPHFIYTDHVPHTTEPAYINTVDAPSIEIIVIGDAGSNTPEQEAVASWMKVYHQNNPVAFVLMLGDNFYENGVSTILDPMFDIYFEQVYDDNLSDIIFYPVLGNHDFRGNIDAQILYTEKSTRWKMPFLYYYHVYYLEDDTKIDFYAVDSNTIVTGNPLAEDQLAWFENVLALSDADWKIVYTHHPVYSNGYHGDNQAMIDRVKPLLEEYAVDLYLNGHDHHLEIIKPYNGVQYCISGAAGKLYSVSAAENSLYAKARLGFMALSINNSAIILKVIVENASTDYELTIEK